jgi:hypothetical protein
VQHLQRGVALAVFDPGQVGRPRPRPGQVVQAQAAACAQPPQPLAQGRPLGGALRLPPHPSAPCTLWMGVESKSLLERPPGTLGRRWALAQAASTAAAGRVPERVEAPQRQARRLAAPRASRLSCRCGAVRACGGGAVRGTS